MTTIRTLAAEHNVQPYELAATLDLGASYDETAELDTQTETEYRDIIAAASAVSRPAGDGATDYGILTDYVTGEAIRPATEREHYLSSQAGPTGVFVGDEPARAVFVAGGPES